MSRHTLCNCPVGFSAAPERHAPDCPGRSGAGKPPRITHERFQELMGNRPQVTEADREVIRIRAAMALSDFDKEDLITYAKEVVSLRAELAALKAGQGEAVAYVLFRDGAVCYEADDNIVISNVPGDETDLYKWRPVYTAPPASADAVSVPRELLERIVEHLEYDAIGSPSEVIAGDLAKELRALLARSESDGVEP